MPHQQLNEPRLLEAEGGELAKIESPSVGRGVNVDIIELFTSNVQYFCTCADVVTEPQRSFSGHNTCWTGPDRTGPSTQ